MTREALTVRTTRGGVTELESRVVAAIVDKDGPLVDSFGDIRPRIPVRSTAKPLQALALVESGAADALAVTPPELTLACASHNGETGHVSAISAWLDRVGLEESTLQCGEALPYLRSIADEYVAAGGHPARLRHNCSGKHAGFLTLGAHLGADPGEYLNPRGAAQSLALAIVAERCAMQLGEDDIVGDGCGAPCPCLTLDALARGWATLLAGPKGSSGARIREAIAANPWNLAGSGRFDTAMVETTSGRVISKVGADGLHIAMVEDVGIVVATKAIDGSRIAAEESLLHLLAKSGALSDAEVEALPRASVRNDAGREVGTISVLD
ncbi:MAG TPA: asparaginase [Galbitalea sp.]|jgi:L-asparaginase II|nr:asparaginase [Galbitalea sp.]